MDEVKFVLRCFVFAAFLLLVSQLKTKNGTIESQIQAVLLSSQAAELVNKIADGGVKMIKDSADYIQNNVKSKNKSETLQQVQADVQHAVAEIQNKSAAYHEAAEQKINEFYKETQQVKSIEAPINLEEINEPIEEIE